MIPAHEGGLPVTHINNNNNDDDDDNKAVPTQ